MSFIASLDFLNVFELVFGSFVAGSVFGYMAARATP